MATKPCPEVPCPCCISCTSPGMVSKVSPSLNSCMVLTFASLGLSFPPPILKLESSGAVVTLSGFFHQRMQPHHFQCFNVTNPKEPERKGKQTPRVWPRALLQQQSPCLLVGCVDWWLVAVVTCSRNMEDLFSSEMCVVCVPCGVLGGGKSVNGSAVCAGQVGAQSRASRGWVFSFSPWSSCLSVPASTTDWDLFMGLGEASLSRLEAACLTCMAL